MLVEAEHGPESAAILVTHSEEVARQALEILPSYIAELPEWRRAFVNNVLSNYGGIVLTNSLDESIQFVNDYAPEHLEVLTSEPFVTLGKLKNAGEILLGHYTPIPTANYCLGLNAILPTGGFAPLLVRQCCRTFSNARALAIVGRRVSTPPGHYRDVGRL